MNNYYSKNALLSYNKLFNFVTGARGIGKTYQFKTWAISDYIHSQKTAWWIMRYATEIDSIVKDSRFFSDITDRFSDYSFKIDGGVGYASKGTDPKSAVWEPFITFKALSESAIKAISDPNCNKIIFDEFIPLPGIRYLKNEAERFLELYFTISRGRDVRAFFLANNVTSVCPYYSYFNVKPSEKEEFTVFDDLVIQNARTEAFKIQMRNTRFGRLISGTHYADYAIENDSLSDTSFFVGPMPRHHNHVFTIKTQYGNFNGFICSPQQLYIKKAAGDQEHAYVFDPQLHDENTMLDYRGKYVVNVIKRYFALGLLSFEDVRTKSEFLAAIDRFIKT